MPKAKYEPIYRSIREDIETGKLGYGDFLPSENDYTEQFGCTRNTVRRALSMLAADGFVLPQHGRGVQVIYRPDENRTVFTIGGIESFAEATSRNQKKVVTKIESFKIIEADEKLSLKTGFDIGSELYYIERIRVVDGKALIFDTNIFLKSETEGLSPAIAADSIYRYLENSLHMTITTSRRRVTAEKARSRDKELLDLDTYDFVLVVTGQVFNSKGVMFEYTQSRHRPDQVCFVESAVRQKV
ncbi:MAG: UTRA domain-containing protein [Solobacterium sp.]|nr:UTRA domain-containing protein [Solobacterium sp.]